MTRPLAISPTTPPDLGVLLLRVWAWSAAAAAVGVVGTAVWMGVG